MTNPLPAHRNQDGAQRSGNRFIATQIMVLSGGSMLGLIKLTVVAAKLVTRYSNMAISAPQAANHHMLITGHQITTGLPRADCDHNSPRQPQNGGPKQAIEGVFNTPRGQPGHARL